MNSQSQIQAVSTETHVTYGKIRVKGGKQGGLVLRSGPLTVRVGSADVEFAVDKVGGDLQLGVVEGVVPVERHPRFEPGYRRFWCSFWERSDSGWPG